MIDIFKPFCDEMEEIHRQDVKELLASSQELISDKRQIFEKYKVMSDLITNIQADESNQEEKNNSDVKLVPDTE